MNPAADPPESMDPPDDALPEGLEVAKALEAPATGRSAQARNPLHGLTLERIVSDLVAGFGWTDLGQRIPLRCFTHDPSIPSSLKFLRKTPWAREKVESLYLFMLREQRRR